MRREQSLETAITAAGTARLTFQPPVGKVWLIDRLEIRVNRGTAGVEPQCRVYRNAEIPQNQHDGTYQGSRNTSYKRMLLRAGELLTVLWSVGTSGNSAAAVLYFDESDATDAPPEPINTTDKTFELALTSSDPLIPTSTDRRSVTFSSGDLINFPFQVLPLTGQTYTSPILDVREWRVINLAFVYQTATDFTEINAVFLSDSAGTSNIGQYRLRTRNNKPIQDSFVAAGPFMRITVTVATTPAPVVNFCVRGSALHLYSGNGVPTVGNNQVGQALVFRGFGALAGGASELIEANFVQHGWATLSLHSSAGGVLTVLRPLDSTNNFFGDHAVIQTTAADLRRVVHIAVPSVLTRLDLINPTGGSIDCAAFVMLGPTP